MKFFIYLNGRVFVMDLPYPCIQAINKVFTVRPNKKIVLGQHVKKNIGREVG